MVINTVRPKAGAENIYLTKAQKFLEGAEVLSGNRDSVAVLAVHAVISACDAVCTRYLGERYKGDKHIGVVELLKKLKFERRELDQKIGQVKRVLSLKNIAEYEDKRISEEDAQEMLKDAERIVKWAESKVKT